MQNDEIDTPILTEPAAEPKLTEVEILMLELVSKIKQLRDQSLPNLPDLIKAEHQKFSAAVAAMIQHRKETL
jgi:hypothetical protein